MRHKMRTLKSNANDMVESWNLYVQVKRVNFLSSMPG
jgi:hypothetical protein